MRQATFTIAVAFLLQVAGSYSPDFGNQLGYDTLAGDGSRGGMLFQANVGVGPYSVLMSQD